MDFQPGRYECEKVKYRIIEMLSLSSGPVLLTQKDSTSQFACALYTYLCIEFHVLLWDLTSAVELCGGARWVRQQTQCRGKQRINYAVFVC
jgi:hypothetical protein